MNESNKQVYFCFCCYRFWFDLDDQTYIEVPPPMYLMPIIRTLGIGFKADEKEGTFYNEIDDDRTEEEYVLVRTNVHRESDV